jgi:signal transduction histidine kinase
MRSPLAGLKGIVNLMSTDSISQEEFIEVSKNLRKNLDYVYNDLDNLLHWANAQVKGIRPQFERVSVQDVVMEKVNLFAEVAKNKSIQIDLNIAANLYVWADINHLRLVFRNLLSNAIKFSAPHSKIEVNAFDEGKIVRMEVKDFGIGMSEEEIQKLFMIENHFTRMGTQNEKGIGLGLILVKEFVETNKGSIAVQSHERKGTTFTVTMESQPA